MSCTCIIGRSCKRLYWAHMNCNYYNVSKWTDLFDDLCRYGGLTDDRLAPPTQPVDGGWLLVRAKVSTETDHLHSRELALDKVNGLLHSLQCMYVSIR